MDLSEARGLVLFSGCPRGHRDFTEAKCQRHLCAYRRLGYSPSNPSVSRTTGHHQNVATAQFVDCEPMLEGVESNSAPSPTFSCGWRTAVVVVKSPLRSQRVNERN